MKVSLVKGAFNDSSYRLETQDGIRVFFQRWEFDEDVEHLELREEDGYMVASAWGDNAKNVLKQIICVTQ